MTIGKRRDPRGLPVRSFRGRPAVDDTFDDDFGVSGLRIDGRIFSSSRLDSSPLKGVGHLVWGVLEKLRFWMIIMEMMLERSPVKVFFAPMEQMTPP